jgi:hypothetical protein
MQNAFEQWLAEHWQEAVKLGQEAVKHLAEFLLVIVTIFLVRATQRLYEATQLLADSATKDSRERKILATTDAWIRLKEQLRKFYPESAETAEERAKNIRSEMVALEAFAQAINTDAYDFHTFARISGSWFLQYYQRRLLARIQKLSDTHKPQPYEELIRMHDRLENFGKADAARGV